MSPQAITVIGALIGPLLVFITFILSRKAQTETHEADAMSKQVASALATTETMRTLLAPMEAEIADLRGELILMRHHISTLEDLIRDLGHNPPPMPFERLK